MTRGEILIQLYWADLYLRIKGAPRTPPEPKMYKLGVFNNQTSRHKIESGEGTSAKLKTYFLEFEKEFLLKYLKELRPRAKPFEVVYPAREGGEVVRMYTLLNELDVPYFVTINDDPRMRRIVFLSETDGVVATAALDA